MGHDRITVESRDVMLVNQENVRTDIQNKVNGIADKLRAEAEQGRKERLDLFHRLVKLEAAEAARVEASRVAFQRAEDE